LTPQFFVQGEMSVPGVHIVLSPGADGQTGIPPLAPPTPVVVEPPVPVVVEPPVPVVVEPPVPVVVEPPVPVVVEPPVPVVDEPPVPLVVDPPVPEPFEPPVPSLTVSPLVQPYPMRPSATIALNPATTNEVRFI